MKTLILSTCKYGLSEFEFVEPLKRIFKTESVKKYNEFTQKDIDSAERIVISGTALQDNDYLNYLKRFDFLKKTNKKVIGICAGYQIIGLVFGSKLIDSKRIGVYLVKTKNKEFKAYFIHKKAIEPSNKFEIIGTTDKEASIIKLKNKNVVGFSFHPEVYNEEIFINNNTLNS